MPETAGGTGRPRMAASRFSEGAHDHGRADSGPVRQRARARVRRGIHARILAARDGRVETVQTMGRQTGWCAISVSYTLSYRTIKHGENDVKRKHRI